MERYVRFVIRNRVLVVVAIALVTVVLGFESSRLKMAIKLKEQLPQEHPYVQIQNTVEDLFGGDSPEVIGVFATHGDIYSPSLMNKVVRLTEGVLNTPGVVRSSVMSLASPNVRSVTSTEDDISIERFADGELTDEKIARMKELLSHDPLIVENLVSEDGSGTIIAMDVGSVPDEELQKNLLALVEREKDDNVQIVLAGGPTLRMEIMRYTALAFPLLLVAIVLIALIHYDAFRTMQAAFLPIVTAILSMIWAMGILGATGQLMDTWSSVTPIAILAVAAGHAVQILKRYYEELRYAPNSHEAIVRALSKVGPVMIRVCLIAAFGFGSLMFVGIRSVRVFGILLAVGILSAMVIEMTLIPAVRAMMTPSQKERDHESREGWLERIIGRVTVWVLNRPIQCLVVTLIVTVVFGLGFNRVAINNNVYNWLPMSSQVRQDYQTLNERLRGATSLKIVVEATEPGALKTPDAIKALNDVEEYIRTQHGLAAVSGFSDIVRRMNKALASQDVIPDSPDLIAQYLLLYEGSGPDALSSVVSADFSQTVIQAFTRDDSTGFAEQVFENIRSFADKRFAGLPIRARVAGGALGVNAAMDQVVMKEKEMNMIQVSAVIFVLASLFLGSIWGGIFVMIPMILALLINIGMMGWSGIWFNMSSAAISAMGVSIGADFAVYLMFRIREEAERTSDFHLAVERALLTSGKAIFFVSSAVIGGYLILCLSPFVIWRHLGLLTAQIILVHALSAVTVLPVLVVLFRPAFLMRKRA